MMWKTLFYNYNAVMRPTGTYKTGYFGITHSAYTLHITLSIHYWLVDNTMLISPNVTPYCKLCSISILQQQTTIYVLTSYNLTVHIDGLYNGVTPALLPPMYSALFVVVHACQTSHLLYCHLVLEKHPCRKLVRPERLVYCVQRVFVNHFVDVHFQSFSRMDSCN